MFIMFFEGCLEFIENFFGDFAYFLIYCLKTLIKPFFVFLDIFQFGIDFIGFLFHFPQFFKDHFIFIRKLLTGFFDVRFQFLDQDFVFGSVVLEFFGREQLFHFLAYFDEFFFLLIHCGNNLLNFNFILRYCLLNPVFFLFMLNQFFF